MRELHHAPRPVVQHQQTWRLHTRTAQRVYTGERRCRLVCACLAFDIVALHGSQTQFIYHTEREKRHSLTSHGSRSGAHPTRCREPLHEPVSAGSLR